MRLARPCRLPFTLKNSDEDLVPLLEVRSYGLLSHVSLNLYLVLVVGDNRRWAGILTIRHSHL